MQSRKMSAVESLASTLIGYSVATAANFYVLPLFGYPVTLRAASSIGIIFTIISLIRGYAVRRFFNWLGLRSLRKNMAWMKTPAFQKKMEEIGEPEGCHYCGAIAGTCAAFPNCPEGRRSQVEQRLS